MDETGTGSSLSTTGYCWVLLLNLHLHVPATDGVFVPAEQGVRFIPRAPPTRAEVERVVLRARKSILRWLRRHGYLDEREPPPAQDDTPDSLRSCQQLALKYGDLVALPSQSQSSERERRFEPHAEPLQALPPRARRARFAALTLRALSARWRTASTLTRACSSQKAMTSAVSA